MAYSKAFEMEEYFDKVINKYNLQNQRITEYYIRIDHIHIWFFESIPFWEVTFGIYTSREDRLAGKMPVKSTTLKIPTQDITSLSDIRVAVYEYCKTLPEFNNVQDV